MRNEIISMTDSVLLSLLLTILSIVLPVLQWISYVSVLLGKSCHVLG